MVGDILVVQPSFIFPTTNTTIINTTNSSAGDDGELTPPDTAEDLKAGSNYLLGVGLCLFAAASCAVSNVLNVKIKGSNESVTTAHLLTTTGLASLLLALVSTVFLPNRQTGPLQVYMLLMPAVSCHRDTGVFFDSRCFFMA